MLLQFPILKHMELSTVTYEYLDSEAREQLVELMEPDYEDIIDLVETLEDTNPMYYDELEASLASGSAEGVRNAAHALKSAFAQIGALNMSQLMKEIEQAGKEGDISPVPGLWERVREERKLVDAAMESWKSWLRSL